MSLPSDKVLEALVAEASQRRATEHAHQEVATTAAPKHSLALEADHSSMTKQSGAPSIATEHSGASQIASEHSSASQVATEPSDTEYDDAPIRPCAICKTELVDDPPPWECHACSQETCYACLGRCYQPGCHQRFCSPCLHEHTMHCLGRGEQCYRAASNATEHGASPPLKKLVRVKLIGAACGERYCHAGVGNVDNGWGIPA